VTSEPITGQLTVDECIRLVEIESLSASQDPVSECVATCECIADCEIAGACLLALDDEIATCRECRLALSEDPE
jgi:hypothetical protein